MDISQKSTENDSNLKPIEIKWDMIGPRRARYAFRMNLQVLVSWEFKN